MKNYNAQNRYKAKHKKTGLCTDCSNIAEPYHILCKSCLDKKRAREKVLKLRVIKYRKENNRCECCRKKLMDG